METCQPIAWQITLFSRCERHLQIYMALLWTVLIRYQKTISLVWLESVGFFRMFSVSFRSDPDRKTRNTDIHGCTDNKCEKYFSLIFLAIVFKPLKFFHFSNFIFLWLLSVSLSALSLNSRAFSPIFWGFFHVKHLSHGIWNSALCMFNNMKPFSQQLCMIFHNQ